MNERNQVSRWRSAAVGLLVGLGFLVGVGIGKRMARTESLKALEKETREPHPNGEEKPGEITVTGEGAEVANIRLAPVVFREVVQTLDVTGEVQPNNDKLIVTGSLVSGRVSQIFVTVGDEVKAGQTLALIDSTEVSQAQAAYAQAVARVAAAKRRWENLKRLVAAGAFSQRPLQEAQKEYADATAELTSAQASLERAQTALDLAKAELRRQQELEHLGAFRYPPLEEAQKELSTARSEVEQARSELTAAQSALVRAETDFQVADRNAARAERLFQIGTLSQRELESAQAERQKAQAEVIKAKREMHAKEVNLDRAQRQLDLAQLKLKREEEVAFLNIRAQSAIQKAEAEVQHAAKELARHQAALEQAARRLEIAKKALQREQHIAEQNLLSQREVQEAQAQYDQAMVELLVAQKALEVLKVEAGRSARIPILAPISGRILERRVSLGQAVTANDTLFVLLDLSSVWVDLRVFEKDISVVKVGQIVSITTPAYPGRTFVGRVQYIGDTLDEKTRTLLVRCFIANPKRLLRPEMFVRARIQVSKRKALVIPVTAYHEDEGKPKVYVQEAPNRFQEREVVLGTRSGKFVEVTAGLKPGDRIVSEGAFLLKSEMRKEEFGEEH
ncbi:MAG: efflux RND transporter periplasmic adaptor subunit [Armatimonadetes bacterium]|nr:efflux RND transporter periplasmic adaptor subunit [Armatimonadota bacterium]MDW8122002.1 efflux RND transporter periplasmic adaptor subunit [Armatimonadota bacterium]